MHDDVTLTIAKVSAETPDAIDVTLAVPEGQRDAFAFQPGQFLPVRAIIDGEEVRRTYSITSPVEARDLRITIKRIPGGVFSTWAHATFKPGVGLTAARPAGRFVLPAGDGSPRHLLGVAAGAGITPVMAMLQHALTHEPATHCTLVFGNRTSRDIIFRQALEDLKDRHLGRLTVIHVLSQGGDAEAPVLAGRITPERLAVIVSRLLPLQEVAHAFLCGPGDMIRGLRAALHTAGMAPTRVHHEFFAPPGTTTRAAAPPLGGPAIRPDLAEGATQIVARIDGVEHRFAAAPGEPVLAAALRAGVRVPYSCKAGMCSTCRARIVEGSVEMRANYSLEPWEIERGFALTCQAVSTSPRLVVDYDQM